MQGAKRRTEAARRCRTRPDPRVGSVTFNPGPDAEDRLWRFFNLAVRLATGDQRRPIRKDPSIDGSGESEE